MFSNFSQPERKKTRFESTTQFSKLLPLLEKLREKEKALKIAINGNTNDPGYLKSYIFSSLVSQLDEIIKEFNISSQAENAHQEIQSLAQLVIRIQGLINSTMENNYDILNIKRSNLNNYAGMMAEVIPAAAVSVTRSIVGKLLIGATTLTLGKTAKEKTGLNDQRSASLCVLEDFSTELSNIYNTYLFGLEMKGDSNVNDTIPLVCPLTKKMLMIPVYCQLDDRIYEHDAITKHLVEKRSSPFNQASMKEDQTVSDVLCRQPDLYGAIYAYYEKHPDHKKKSDYLLKASGYVSRASCLMPEEKQFPTEQTRRPSQ